MFSKATVALAVLMISAPVLLGTSSCSEPKEYCKIYKNREDRNGCSEYCSSNKEFSKDEKVLIACQAGQLLYLSDPNKNAAAAAQECDQQSRYAAKIVQIACRAGVAAENARYSKHKDPDHGTSGGGGDRETGNRGGGKQRF